jgi:hypothetical protein
VGLRKPGVYVLNALGGEAGPAATPHAIRVANAALLLFVLLGLALSALALLPFDLT